ncbi:MAG TPA: PLP-dependent transferase [Thermoanaerobaculia bacterium]|nr:PLP-dependent transferase [Thermoanaerobaculia bacterium]
MRFETLAVHAGRRTDETGGVAPPVHLATTFERDAAGAPVGGYTYIRESHPMNDLLEAALGPLDGGEAALAFASGMAAGAAVLQALPPGGRVVLPDDVYYGVRVMAREFLPSWGLSASFCDMTDLGALERTLKAGATLLWLESPSNPLLAVTDLAAASSLARSVGALVLVDGTFATPVLQRPIELGADVVLHATTKYVGGHSDVQGGALVFGRKGTLYEKVRHVRHLLGAVPAPFNSWLVLRGLRSLACRMARHSASGLAVARALALRPEVSVVHYPGLASHPGHAVAARQMSAFGGMLSFRAKGGAEAAVRCVARANLFTRATSLGGVESLIEHRATSEGPGGTAPPDLVRLSIGLEHPDDLVEDLVQALS